MLRHVEVVVMRGAICESRHDVQVAACDAAGRLAFETGAADRVTTFRSAAKPFQLLPLVERGHADAWGFVDEALAVMCASHVGSAYHLGLVRAILDRIGLDETALACGPHDPLDPEALADVHHGRVRPSRLHNNCSGKHAGMLALARSEGWPIEGYERESHPLQQLMRRTVAECAGLAPETLGTAVDGCSVVVFALPLTGMARAYARLAVARADGDARERALARIRGAMLAYPRATGGEGRFSTMVIERSEGAFLAKGGAEGLECLAIPGAGLGVAFKCDDGNARALPPAVVAALDALGVPDAAVRARLSEWRAPLVHNHAGQEVGSLEARVREPAPAAEVID